MERSKTIAIAAATLFAALWAYPLARAISFFSWAQDYFSETSSINASNDLRFSSWLLTCYLVSLLAAFAFAWILSRRLRFWLILPGALLALAAGEVLWLRPEAPIHLFPTMAPWRPVFISFVAVDIAALFSYFPRTVRSAMTETPNQPLDRMTRSAVTPLFQGGHAWRAPRHRSACR